MPCLVDFVHLATERVQMRRKRSSDVYVGWSPTALAGLRERAASTGRPHMGSGRQHRRPSTPTGQGRLLRGSRNPKCECPFHSHPACALLQDLLDNGVGTPVAR